MTCGCILSFFPLSYAALIDLDRRVIPDQAVYLIACCALLDIGTGAALPLTVLIGTAVIGGLFLIAAVETGGIGGGDVKLSAALGALLGVHGALLLQLLSLIILISAGKILRRKSLPFAPCVWGAFFIYSIILQRSGSM